jgi:hypothetical protein
MRRGCVQLVEKLCPGMRVSALMMDKNWVKSRGIAPALAMSLPVAIPS